MQRIRWGWTRRPRASGGSWRRKSGPVESLQAEFGFIASPVKPLPHAWRNACLHYGPVAKSKVNFFFGPGHGGCPVDPHDTAKLCRIWNVDTKGKNPDEILARAPAGSLEKPSTDPAFKEHVTKTLGRRFWEGIHDRQRWRKKEDPHKTRRCWFFNAKMYFEGNRSKAFRTFFPGDWTLDPSSGWFHLTPVETYRDFFAFHMELWHRHWYMPGLYFDEVYVGPDYNVFNGNGKVMPDGTVRPTVPLMHQRKLLNRMRQQFVDHGRKPFIWVHTSNYMAPHAISAADVAMFGEDRSPTPQVDIIDTIPGILMRTIGRGQKYGFIPIWMVMAGRGGDQWSFAGRQTYGWCWMHDTVPEYHTTWRAWPVAVLRQGWGIDENDVSFHAYWESDSFCARDDGKFLVSAWTKPGGKALIQVMNLHHTADGRTDVMLRLKADRLGLPETFTVYDAESVPELVEGERELRECGRLKAEDEAANKSRIAELSKHARRTMGKVVYDRAKFRVMGKGPTLTVTVPARDFRTLVVE